MRPVNSRDASRTWASGARWSTASHKRATPLRRWYYDLPRYRPFWSLVEQLDVPFYLHPRNPLPADAGIYNGHPWLMGPTWAFGQETAVHALRLMGSGLFDEHPRLTIVLGHLGEGLPYQLWRVDHCNGWVGDRRHDYAARKPIAEYFASNFYITTSGNFRTQTLVDAMLELGADRILFSTDWPFENVGDAARLVRLGEHQ